jgi:hypothetical protein
MENKMYKCMMLILVFSIGLSIGLWGISGSVEYGFKMLNIPVGVGISGQGNTGTFTNQDASGFLENPAATVLRTDRLISFTQNSYLMDTNQNSICYSNSNGKKHFGIGMRTLDYGSIDKRDDSGQIIGTFHPLDLNLVVSAGFRLHPDHYVGINAGLLYEKIDAASSYGTSFDFGYVFLPPIRETKLYATLRNIGMTSKMDEESVKLPTRLDLGICRELPTMTNLPLLTTIEFKSISESGSAWRGNLGLHTSYQDIFSFRLGTDVNYLLSAFYDNGYQDAPTWTIGAGFKVTHFLIDYAYTPYKLISAESDSVHRVGVTYQF